MQPELNVLIVAARRESPTLASRPRIRGFAAQLAYSPDGRLDVGNAEVDDDLRLVVAVMDTLRLRT